MLQLVNLASNWSTLVRTDGRKVEPLPDIAPAKQWVIAKTTRKGGRMVAAVGRPTTNVPRGLQRTYLLNDALGSYSAPANPEHRQSFSSDLDGLMLGLMLHSDLGNELSMDSWSKVVAGV